MSTLLTFALLALVPALFLATTSFVKLSVVFSILRNALGTGQVPSGAVISVLALLLSVYIMAPVGEEMVRVAMPSAAQIDPDQPFEKGSFQAWRETIDAAKEPLRRFLKANAGSREVDLFYSLAQRQGRTPATWVGDRDDLLVLLPAFLFSELREAFVVGFLVFLPFLVLDLLVANAVVAMGLSTMSPSTISLPFKLLLFVAVDGWYVLAESLVASYAS